MLERSADALKLVGEPYLARVHLVATRVPSRGMGAGRPPFDRPASREFTRSLRIRQPRTAPRRIEVIIVLLIVFEIAMTFFRH